MQLLVADTETTGTADEDRLCQFACIGKGVTIDELFRPPLPIKYEAMAVHHITNEMVEDRPEFKGSKTYQYLKGVLPKSVFVAHNAQFDIRMLEKEGLQVPHFIDTLKVVRHLDTQCQMSNYQMQYLRYRLGVNVPGNVVAHDALGDVKVLVHLFHKLTRLWIKRMDTDPDNVFIEMEELSRKPIFIRKMQFGKHRGKLTEDVLKEDRGYLEWLYTQKTNEPEGEEDWIYTLEELLK